MHETEARDPRVLLSRWLVTSELPWGSDESLAIRLSEAAREQGVAGLLHRAICEQRACWPQAACLRLRQAEEEHFAVGVRQLDTASRLQFLFEAAGVCCLPLKGVALAERLYGSVADRPMRDIDLLVLDNWSRAVNVIEEAGFVRLTEADHALAFVDPSLGTAVELHRGVTSCARLFPLDPEATWRRSRQGAGLVKRVPSSEDLLVHLSLHAAFQHGLVLRLVQYLDFRRLLERDPPDLALLDQVATGAQAQSAVALALEVARAVVAAPVSLALERLITKWLPNDLRSYVASRLDRDASAFFAPATPALAWVRWQLATGRRIALVRETLRPTLSSFSKPAGLWAASRALGLARRWGLPTLRSLGARPQR